MRGIPERDWKYLSSLRPELLEELSRRINEAASNVLADTSLSQNDKRLKLFTLVEEQDRVVADCFDGAWSRSNAVISCMLWRGHGLLTDEHLQHLTAETRECLPARKPASPAGQGN